MKYLLTIVLALMVVGCNSSRSYSTGRSKNPIALTLNSQGDYHLLQTGMAVIPIEEEFGQWWAITDQVVILLPNSADKPEHYVRISQEQSLFGNLLLHDDLRPAFDEHFQIEDFVGTAGSKVSKEAQVLPAYLTRDERMREMVELAFAKREFKKELSDAEYRVLVTKPYAREPFQDDEILSKVYYAAYREAVANETRDPGGLYIYPSPRWARTLHAIDGERQPNNPLLTMWEAAREAGYHAGMTGESSQLTDDERREIEEWKKRYLEVILW